jgi:uncharacterized protein (TIGR02588 family)
MAVSAPDPRGDTPDTWTADRTEAPRDAKTPGHDTRGTRASKRRDASSEPRSTAEWVTLAISSLILLGLFGLTTYFYLTGSTAPATVEVEPRLAETYQAGSRFYLPLTIRNTGGETGEEVRVRVSVTDRSGRQEAAEVMVTFLAGGGSSKAVAAFGSDPRQGQVEAVVVSYLEP